MRHLTIICFLFGGGMLLAAAALYLRGEDGPGVAIEAPEREGLALTAGASETLEFRLHNPTRHGARVVGLAPC